MTCILHNHIRSLHVETCDLFTCRSHFAHLTRFQVSPEAVRLGEKIPVGGRHIATPGSVGVERRGERGKERREGKSHAKIVHINVKVGRPGRKRLLIGDTNVVSLSSADHSPEISCPLAL